MCIEFYLCCIADDDDIFEQVEMDLSGVFDNDFGLDDSDDGL